jgi:sigma-E factor negative regulatory protein RseB
MAAGLGCAACAWADDAPHEWLARMEQALNQRNYQGTFVHEHDGQTETLRVVHRVAGGELAERIVSLDGSGREFIRHQGELRTYFPERRVVLVESGPNDGLLLAELRRLDTAGAQLYRVSELPQARVSGRAAHLIAVEPLDDLRFGYRIWIDEASAMPLKTQLRAVGGRVVEQLVFTELTLPERIPDAALVPAMDVRDWRWLRVATTTSPAAEPGVPEWQAGQLPPGFRMTANTVQALPGSGSVVTHLVFSDGVASVSVFVEPQRGAPAQSADTLTSVGSSSALSTVVAGHKVTAIGEVPPGTVRAIAAALRAVPAQAAGQLPGGRPPGPPGPGVATELANGPAGHAAALAPGPTSALQPQALSSPALPPRSMSFGGSATPGAGRR